MKTKRLNDKSAQKEISSYLVKQKKSGISKISILDVSSGAKLPFKQIDRIMGKFEQEGKVKEV